MTKTSFYSMMRKGNKTQAVLHNGYSDETFYYYNNNGWWHAVHPLNGLSVASGKTRKEAQEATKNIFERLRKIDP